MGQALAAETKFTRQAWWVLGFVLFLVAASAGQLFYRFTLPTDGWSYLAGTFSDDPSRQYLFVENIVGTESPIRPGDGLLAYGGHSVTEQIDQFTYMSRPVDWYAGSIVHYTVARNGETLALDVPIKHWTWQAFVQQSAGNVLSLLGNLSLFAVGLFTFLARPNNFAARVLFVFGAVSMAVSISGLLPDGVTAMFEPVAYYGSAFFNYVIFGVLFGPTILALTFVFPKPITVVERHWWVALLPYGLGLVVLIGLVTTGRVIIGWAATLSMLVASMLLLIHSWFTLHDAVSRAQLRWALGGFLLSLASFLLAFPAAFQWVRDPFWYGALYFPSNFIGLILGISLAVAITRYHLFEIDVLIRRTVTYTVVGALLLLIYFGSVILLQHIFAQVTGPRSELATILSTLAIVGMFVPLRNRVQAALDKRFNRKKYDAKKVLQKFSETVRDETDLDKLTTELVNVVQETTQPKSISLWLKRTEYERKASGSHKGGQHDQ